MVHKLNRSYIIIESVKRPFLKIVEAPTERRKAKALAKKLSGETSDVAWIADSTNVLYKSGERRI